MAQILKIEKRAVVVGTRADLAALFDFQGAQTIEVEGRLAVIPEVPGLDAEQVVAAITAAFNPPAPDAGDGTTERGPLV